MYWNTPATENFLSERFHNAVVAMKILATKKSYNKQVCRVNYALHSTISFKFTNFKDLHQKVIPMGLV